MKRKILQPLLALILVFLVSSTSLAAESAALIPAGNESDSATVEQTVPDNAQKSASGGALILTDDETQNSDAVTGGESSSKPASENASNPSDSDGTTPENPASETPEGTTEEQPAVPSVEPGLSNFKPVADYRSNFKDVPADAWYAENVKQAFNYGLIVGISDTLFSPNGNLTVAECATLAARLHSIYNTGNEKFPEAAVWYEPYISYDIEAGILSGPQTSVNQPISRADFAVMMAATLPEQELAPVNTIPDGSIPDVLPGDRGYAEIYKLYRAGILNGTDDWGSALPNATLKRCEAAAILIRMVDPGVRIGFTLSTETTVYNVSGATKTIPVTQLAAAQKDGWYREPVTTMYKGQESRVVAKANVEVYKKLGWSTNPFREIPSSIKSKGKTTTTIPVVSVSTGGKEVLSKSSYVNCTVNIYNVNGDKALFDATGGIRLRGNASSFYGNVSKIRANPVPYRLKFDSKVNMLGLNDGAKCKSWVLLTNLDTEKDVIKNDIAFRMGRMLMEPDNVYCSDAQMAHLYLNGKFLGTYLVCEQNQANKNRVNVAEPEDGYTGTDVGYFVEMDGYYEKPNFMMNYEGATVKDIAGTSRKFRANSYTVKTDTFSQNQVDFIAKYIRGVFKIVYQACEKGNYLTFDANYNVVKSSYTNAKDCIGAVMDLNSVVDMYILYEIMCDYDVGESSFFMCVDFSKDSKYPKLTFTAPWDFNWTCQGSATGSYHAATFRSSSFASRYGDRSNPWFILFYKQQWFRSMVIDKWKSIGGSQGINQCINQENSLISLYRPDLNRRTPGIMDGAKTHLNWIQKRAAWLDTKWR